MPEPRSGAYRSFARLLQPYGTLLIAAGAAAAIGSVFAIVPAYVAFRILAELLAAQPQPRILIGFAIVLGGSVLLQNLFGGMGRLGARLSAFELTFNTRLAVVARIGALPLDAASALGEAELVAAVTTDIERLGDFVAVTAPEIAGAALLPLVAFLLMSAVDLRLALLAVAPVPLVVLLQMRAAQSAPEIARRGAAALEALVGALLEYARGVTVRRSFGIDARAIDRLAGSFREYRAAQRSAWQTDVVTLALSRGLTTLPILFVLPFGAAAVRAGHLGVPYVLLLAMIGVALMAPFERLARSGTATREALVAAARVDRVLRTPPLSVAGALQVTRADDVAFDGVTFAYAVAGRGPALRDVTAALPSPGVTAIVGKSGSGKTTLARLIARYADPAAGAVTLGGVDLRALAPSDVLFRQSAVLQDVFLVRDTVRENIRMGTAADTRAVAAAALAAGAHAFIAALPLGYDTVLGEGGAGLSAGQKQRIAVARALLRDAPILVLDEATSAIDPDTESLVHDAFATYARDRRVIVIAHRLAIVRDADAIVVLDEGRVEAIGRHDALLASSTTYRRLWHEYETATSWRLPA